MSLDPMGTDLYMIDGKVIGKERVSKNDPWHPIVKVESWEQIDLLKEWGIQVGFIFQIILIGLVHRFFQRKARREARGS